MTTYPSSPPPLTWTGRSRFGRGSTGRVATVAGLLLSLTSSGRSRRMVVRSLCVSLPGSRPSKGRGQSRRDTRRVRIGSRRGRRMAPSVSWSTETLSPPLLPPFSVAGLGPVQATRATAHGGPGRHRHRRRRDPAAGAVARAAVAGRRACRQPIVRECSRAAGRGGCRRSASGEAGSSGRAEPRSRTGAPAG